jgi:hypothetical protein
MQKIAMTTQKTYGIRFRLLAQQGQSFGVALRKGWAKNLVLNIERVSEM